MTNMKMMTMKKTIEELAQTLFTLRKEYVNKKFLHYKGDVYSVENLSINESDNEVLISYCSVKESMQYPNPVVFTRPLKEFNEKFKRVNSIDFLVTEEEFQELASRFGTRK